MKKLFLFLTLVGTLASCTSNQDAKAQESDAKQTEVNKQQVVIDNIMSRHSVRVYKPEQVSKEKIDTLLQAAINAPSANNKQPWEIRVVQNPEILGKINTLKENIFYNSPTVIVIAKDKTNPYGDFDCGLLSQSIMLTAESMDLGTCALGGLARLITSPEGKEINDALKLPADYEVVIAMSLGYKNETPTAKPREAAKIQFID